MWLTASLLLFVLVSGSSANLKDDIKAGRAPIRGVNLGGWLVGEYWMTKSSPVWRGLSENDANKGEYTAMKLLGHTQGDAQWDEHRRTFITEQDFREMATAKLNTVRIPVGYWIVGFDNSGGGDPNGWKVYAPGGINYLDKAIREWAPRNNILVLLSFHAAKGAQNPNDNSSPQNPGNAYWSQYSENVNNTLDAVTWLARRYKYDSAFLGIGLLNEPWWGQSQAVLKQYYYDAYGRIRNDVQSDCLLITDPLIGEQDPWQGDWQGFMPPPNFQGIRHDWHRYQVWGYNTPNWNAEKIINYVNTDLKNDILAWHGNWLFIGEWSCATDGSIQMSDDQLRRYAQAQLNTFSNAVGGWAFWAWKFYNDVGGKNGWSMRAMINGGFLHL